MTLDDALRVDARTTIPASDLTFTAVRASGPGGQNVNKVASKVELRFDLPGCRALGPEVKARLRALAGKRIDAEGRIRLVSQRTRDQVRNREDALDRLAALIREALTPPRPRRPTRPTRASKTRRLQDKRLHATKKRMRARIGSDD